MFKTGDKVKCIDNEGANNILKLNQIYIIKGFDTKYKDKSRIKLQGVVASWFTERFIIEQAKKSKLPGWF